MSTMSRRSFLKLSASAAAAATFGGALSACGPGSTGSRAIKIGYVSPQTGPLAGFGEADAFILKGMGETMGKKLGGRAVEILAKDSQSDPNRAASVAADLITKDKIDLMVVASTPENANPVCDQCEANGIPTISTMVPWQPWYFRNPNVPQQGYQWTYHYFWGLEDIIGVFLSMWDAMPTNKAIGGMWPNDGDGLAWSDAKLGFPPAVTAKGYTVVDPGRYQNLTSDFSAQITQFKNAGVEIVTGVMIPPDLVTFMSQASQQGFKPNMVTVGKAALFPSSVAAIGGSLGDGLTSEIWWSPSHPFKSSLTGASAADLTGAYTKDVGKPWTQPIGFIHSLFEVATDVLSRAPNVDDKAALRDAIKATKLDTIVGPIAWGAGPTPNVTKTPLVGGQWGKKGDAWDLAITSNASATNIPIAGELRAMPWSA